MTPLADMYSQDQTTRFVSAEMPAAERLDANGSYYATTRLLEECMESCETLAGQLGPDPRVIWLQDLVAECIAACAGLLAATVRASRYTSRYAMFAGELLAELADALTPRSDLASKFCEVLCRALEDLVRKESAAALAN